MEELLPEALRASMSQAKDGKKKRREQIHSPQQWTECFNTFVAVVISKEPQRAADLLAYASLIVHYARQFKGAQWQVYDSICKPDCPLCKTIQGRPMAGI